MAISPGGSSDVTDLAALGIASSDATADLIWSAGANGMALTNSDSGATDPTSDGTELGNAIFLAWKTALEELQAAFASIPGIGGDQFAQFRDLLDSNASVLQTIGDRLSQFTDGSTTTGTTAAIGDSTDGSASTGTTAPIFNSTDDSSQTTYLDSSNPSQVDNLTEAQPGDLALANSDSLASLGQANTFPYGPAGSASSGGTLDSSSTAVVPFIFDDTWGQYGLADLIATNAAIASAAGQDAVGLWANLLDVYRPSGQAALGLGQSEGGATASVLAASSLAQNPTGA